MSGCEFDYEHVENTMPSIAGVEFVTNPLLNFPEITESIVETIIELTTIICSTSLDEPISQLTLKTDSEILKIINKIRRDNNLNSLEMSSDLCLIAEIRAKEASEKWSHTRPDGTMVDRLADERCIEWRLIGENLAKHSNAKAKSVVNSWFASDSHRKNILNSKFAKCGLGEFECDGATYIAMIFSD